MRYHAKDGATSLYHLVDCIPYFVSLAIEDAVQRTQQISVGQVELIASLARYCYWIWWIIRSTLYERISG
jgi:hypothetical protein